MSIAAKKKYYATVQKFVYIVYFQSKGVFFQVVIAFDPTAGFGSNYNTKCIVQLPIIPPNFSSLRLLEAEKQLPKIRDGFVYLGDWCSKLKLPSTRPTTN